jgi:hypothetical protein
LVFMGPSVPHFLNAAIGSLQRSDPAFRHE